MTTNNLSHIVIGSYNAIGDGAQVIIIQAKSAAEEAERNNEIENQKVAEAVVEYLTGLTAKIDEPNSRIDESPYRSLSAYRILDKDLFFGRDNDIETLSPIIKKPQGITIIHAKSGIGKTSLLRAGLAANLLIERCFPLYVRPWHKPPVEAIKETLYSNYKIFPGLQTDSLSNFIRRIRESLTPSTPLIIFLDQFEEFFLYLDQNQRQDFIGQLGDCLDDPLLAVHFVLSLRADDFSSLSEFKLRIPHIFVGEHLLKPLSKTEAKLAIIKPAEIVGISYESQVVDDILTELPTQQHNPTTPLATDEITPAPLQLICSALYQQIQETNRKVITLHDFEQMGRVSGILNSYLQRVLEREIEAHLRKQARATLIALVDSQNRRITKTATEIARDTGSVDTLPQILDQLVQSRLLNRLSGESHDEETIYELTHEYLIERIQLTAEEQEIKFATELLYKAVDDHERDPTILLDEKRLQIIELQEDNLIITTEANKLLVRSKNEVITQKRSRIIRIISILILVVIVIAILIIAASLQESGRIANEALKTATQVIRSAQNDADKARATQSAAETAASMAQTAEYQAITAKSTAEIAAFVAQTAEVQAVQAKHTAQTAQLQAENAQGTAEAEQYKAQTAQATAEIAKNKAIEAQQTAEIEATQAYLAEQTAVAARDIAHAKQLEAEQAQREAEAAQREAEASQRAAEAARNLAIRAQQTAEIEATKAYESLKTAEALRDLAITDLGIAEQESKILRMTQNCRVNSDVNHRFLPKALIYDQNNYIWVVNTNAKFITRLDITNCNNMIHFPVEESYIDISYGNHALWVASFNSSQITRYPIINNNITNTNKTVFTVVGKKTTAILYTKEAIWVTASNDKTSGTLYKLHPETATILATANTEQEPSAILYDGTYIWVSNKYSNSVSQFESISGNLINKINVGSNPTGLAFDKLQQEVWVANNALDDLTKISLINNHLTTKFVSANDSPDALVFDGVNIWVTGHGNNNLIQLAPVSEHILTTFPTGRTPTDILFDGLNMWVVSKDDDLIQKMPVSIAIVGNNPNDMIYDGEFIWVANFIGNSISQVSDIPLPTINTIEVGLGPVALEMGQVTVNSKNIWVANKRDKTITQIKITTGASPTTKTIAIDFTPESLTYDGTYIWVANKEDNNVIRIHEQNHQVTGPFLVGKTPVDILYDGQQIWVLNMGDKTIQSLTPEGDIKATYLLSKDSNYTFYNFLFADGYFWMGYTFGFDQKTGIRKIQLVDKTMVFTEQLTGGKGSPEIIYQSPYIWVSSYKNNQVTKIESANLNILATYTVCETLSPPSSLLVTNRGIWVACQNSSMIQKLPDALQISSQSKIFTYLPIVAK